MGKRHVIDLAFKLPADGTDSWKEVWHQGNEAIDALTDEFGGVGESAGTGFGCRDMQIVFRSRNKAKSFRKALTTRLTNLEFEYVSYYNEQE